MPRQPLSFACALAVLMLCMAATRASAEYSVTLSGTITGPGTCDANGVVVPTSDATVTYDLPAPPDNVIITTRVLGGATHVEIASFPTTVTVDSSPDFGIDLTTPATPPYTIVLTDFPAIGGVPTGFGIKVTATCDAEGVGTLVYANDVPAQPLPPAATNVPTLSGAGLASLALAIAVLFARMEVRRWQTSAA